jgi:uncharacterized protein YcaQ
VSTPVTIAELRERAVAAQGFAARQRTARPAEVEAIIDQLSAVQLDSISAVERAHRLTIGSRVGTYPKGTVSKLLESGRVFEYWAHEACVLPISDWPLYRSVMLASSEHPWWGPILEKEPELTEQVMAEVAERGPLGSRHFEGEGSGGMWGYKPAKRVLEALWSTGRLVIAGRQGFQRLYDLPERVIPDEVLGAPVPDETGMLRGLIERSVRARGVLTESGVVEHNRLRGGIARIRDHVAALVDEGRLRRLEVADGGAPVLVAPGEPADGRGTAVLLSPFDNLLWDRALADRILGFRHIIEVYKRPHEREYGYYVLPFLHGTRLVARCDVKTDRKAGELRLLALHPEPKVRWTGSRDEALDRALQRLASLVGVSSIVRAA